MKKYVVRGVAALAALFVVVASFVPLTAEAADYETVPWVVDIINSSSHDFEYELNYQVASDAVDFQPWSVMISSGKNGLVFSYSVPSMGGVSSVTSNWVYPNSDLEIIEFTVISGNVTKTFSAGQIASADMFAVAPYRYGQLPSVIKIASKAEKELTFWQKIDSIFDLLRFFLGGTPSNIFDFFGDWLFDFDAVLKGIRDLLSPSGSSDDLGSGELEDFEQDYLDRIESGMTDLGSDIDVDFLAPTFAFIGGRVSALYDDLGSYRVVFILPVFIGILFVLMRHSPRDIGL